MISCYIIYEIDNPFYYILGGEIIMQMYDMSIFLLYLWKTIVGKKNYVLFSPKYELYSLHSRDPIYTFYMHFPELKTKSQGSEKGEYEVLYSDSTHLPENVN